MNRAFTQREKVLLLILTALLLGLGYFKFFYEPVEAAITAAESRQADAESEMVVEQARLAQLRAMQRELDELKAAGRLEDAELPAYSNVENVMVQLNAILSASTEYGLTFQEVQFGENGLVARPIQMTFTAQSYQTARRIIDDLYHCWYRCRISDITVSAHDKTARSSFKDVSRSAVDVNLTATFFERR